MKQPNVDEIILNLTTQNNYTGEKASQIVQILHDYIKKLTTIRHSKVLTIKTLKELDGIPDNDMRVVKHWLIESLRTDDTFKYAYNHLATFWNRDPGAFYTYNLIDIPDDRVTLLIASETQAQEVHDKHSQKSSLTHDELEKVKESLKEYVNFISISKFYETITALNESKMLLGNSNLEFAAVTLILYKTYCKKSVEFKFWLSAFAEKLNRSYTNYKPANKQLSQKKKKVLIKCPFLDTIS